MTIETSHDSAIMTYGLAKDPRRPWILGFVSVVLIGMLVGLGLFLGLDQKLPRPAHTGVLISAIPASLDKHLSPQLHASLSPLWREVVSGGSHWPVLLGAVPTSEGWQTYAVFPRWRRGTIKHLRQVFGGELTVESHGLVVFVSDHSVEPSESIIRYPKGVHWWFQPGWMTFQLMPEALSSTSSQQMMGSFTGYVKDRRVVTDVPVRESLPSVPLQTTDVSLLISPSTSSAWQTWLRPALPLGDRPDIFAHLPLQRINVSLKDGEGIERFTIQFSQDLNKNEAREVLASFGIVSKRVVQVDDGTLAVEQTLLDASHDERLFGTYKTSRFGDLELSPTTFVLGTTGTDATVPSLSGCGPAHPIARLSSKALQQMLRQLGVTLSLDQLKPVQFFSEHNVLSVCLEE